MNQVGIKSVLKGGKIVLKTAEKIGELKQQAKSVAHNGERKVKQAVNKVEKAVKSKK